MYGFQKSFCGTGVVPQVWLLPVSLAYPTSLSALCLMNMGRQQKLIQVTGLPSSLWETHRKLRVLVSALASHLESEPVGERLSLSVTVFEMIIKTFFCIK